MEFQRIDLSKRQLEVGSVIFAIKTGDYYTLTATTPKFKLEQINGNDTKELSQSTLNRWYRLVVGYGNEVPVEQAQQPETVEPEVVAEPQPEEVTPEPQPEEINTPDETSVTPSISSEELEPPMNPATPQRARKAPNSQEADPVLTQLRQRIIDEVLSTCPNASSKETSSYTGLKAGKYNFAEVGKGKKRFSIRVIAKALNQDSLAICNIAPPSYGWTLDATFTILSEQDFDTAINLLKSSYAYRIANTPNK